MKPKMKLMQRKHKKTTVVGAQYSNYEVLERPPPSSSKSLTWTLTTTGQVNNASSRSDNGINTDAQDSDSWHEYDDPSLYLETLSVDEDDDDEDEDGKTSASAVEKQESMIDRVQSQVREDWIDAMFGSNNCNLIISNKASSRSRNRSRNSGMGCIHFGNPYISHITSPIRTDSAQALGMTISRITLGVFASHVDPASEAAVAGILPGSVLLKINGLCIAADPSHITLQRLYQYQTGRAEFPIGLEFIYKAKPYRVLLHCPTTQQGWGIAWAPVGNFPLLQHVSKQGLAYQSGIRHRGSLLSSITLRSDGDSLYDSDVANEISCSFRHYDHSGMAAMLQKLFSPSQEQDLPNSPPAIQVTLTYCYVPEGSRSYDAIIPGKHQKSNVNNNASRGILDTTTMCTAHQKDDDDNNDDEDEYIPVMTLEEYEAKKQQRQREREMQHLLTSSSFSPMVLSRLATMVSLGKIPPIMYLSDAPELSHLNPSLAEAIRDNSEDQQQLKSKHQLTYNFDPCPTITWEPSATSLILPHWNVIADLHHAVSYHACGYNEDALATLYTLFYQRVDDGTQSSSSSSTSSSSSSSFTQQQHLLNETVQYLRSAQGGDWSDSVDDEQPFVFDGAQICDTFLLQILDSIVRYGSLGEGSKLNSVHTRNATSSHVNCKEDSNAVLLDKVLWSKVVVSELSEALIFQVRKQVMWILVIWTTTRFAMAIRRRCLFA